MKQERAETMALAALGWLAANDELMPVFMGSTGATLDDLRERAGEADFLASVLDFILMEMPGSSHCAMRRRGATRISRQRGRHCRAGHR